MPDLNLGNVSLAAIAVGFIAALWSKLKALCWRILNLAVVKISISGHAEPAVRAWLWKHGKRSRYGERYYEGDRLMVRNLDRRTLVGYETPSHDPAIMWIGWTPVLVFIGSHNFNQFNSIGIRLTLMFLRWSFDPDKLLLAAIAEANARQEGSSYRRFAFRRAVGTRGMSKTRQGDRLPDIEAGKPPEARNESSTGQRYLGYTPDEIGPPIPEDPMGYLAIPDQLQPVLASVRRWLASEKWYKRRSIPWRMGVAMTGPPGCGKTSMAKALAQELDLPVVSFELATFNDQDMVSQWHNIQSEAPCMVLIEDIDSVFEGRTNITDGDEPGLTFGCLLNCLSGIEGADGILTIVTTNRPETLDPALGVVDEQGRSSRPGRIDRIARLEHLDEKGRRHIAARILADCPDEIERTVASGAGESGAQFTQRCADIAMARWKVVEETHTK